MHLKSSSEGIEAVFGAASFSNLHFINTNDADAAAAASFEASADASALNSPSLLPRVSKSYKKELPETHKFPKKDTKLDHTKHRHQETEMSLLLLLCPVS